mgnify:FL=1
MRIPFLITSLLLSFTVACQSVPPKPPFVDVHTHYNWDQEELVSPQQALQILRENNVQLAVVFGTPSHNVLKLSDISDGLVVPFFSPYIKGQSRHNWFYDEQVLQLARAGLAEGRYHGIGEVHVVSSFGPRRDNPILQGLLKLAAEFDVPFTIHTEASDYRFLSRLCQQHDKVRFLWAHAGGILGPEHSEGILRDCPNVWIELSARDPKHYGGIVDEAGHLRQGWREVLLAHPDRFMVGTDPVWNAHQIERWYEADEGWLHFHEFIDFHNKWLSELPAHVADQVRYKNGMVFFGRTP